MAMRIKKSGFYIIAGQTHNSWGQRDFKPKPIFDVYERPAKTIDFAKNCSPDIIYEVLKLIL